MKKLFGLLLAIAVTAAAPAARAAPVASIDFVQGALNPPAGFAACTGVTGTSVGVSNGSNAGVLSWQIDLAYAPGTSGSMNLASSNSSSTPAASFNPSVTGCYRVILYVWPVVNRAGAYDYDVRNFCIPEAGGMNYILPPAQIFPKTPPALASGLPGAKANELNCSGQENGYAGLGNGTDKFDLQQKKDINLYLPTAAQKAALVGTNGTPGSGNPYVTSSDPRLTGGGGGSGGGLSAPVANSSLATMPAHTFKINNTGSSATPIDATISQVKTELNYTPADIGAQPVDADLTAWAGLSWAADTCGYFTGAGAAATYSCPSGFRTFAAASSASAQRTAMGVAIGTNVQAWDADLDALSALSSAANKIPYATGAQTWALTDYSALARTWDAYTTSAQQTAALNAFTSSLAGLVPASGGGAGNFLRADGTWAAPAGGGGGDMLASNNLSDLVNKATSRTNLGVAIGTNVEAWDADLDAIAGLTSAADKLPYSTAAQTWSLTSYTAAARTFDAASSVAAEQAALSLTPGTNVQAQDAELQAIAGLTSAADRVPYYTGSGTAALATYTSTARTWDAASSVAAETALLNTATSSLAGLCPALGGSATTYLNGAGAMTTPADATKMPLAGGAFTGPVTFADAPIIVPLHDNGNKSGASPALASFSTTAPNQKWTLSANVTGVPTVTMPSGPAHLQFEIWQGSGGPYTTTWWTSPTTTWSGTASPTTPITLQTTVGGRDVVSCWWDNSTLACSGPQGASSGGLVASNNLSDLTSASTARTNLGLGTSAVANLCAASDAEAGTSSTLAMTPAASAALWNKGTDNSGGATITMGDGGSFNLITSTTAITTAAFTNDAAGRKAVWRFNTVRVLTHNATSFILPNAGGNITTAVGDLAWIESLGSGNFRIDFYQRADGTPLVGGGSGLPTTGGTMSGNIAMGTNSITGIKASSYVAFDNGNIGGANVALATWSNGTYQKATLTSSMTGTTTWTPTTGQPLVLDLIENGTGGFAIVLPTGIVWDGGTAPTPVTTANAINTYSFRYDGTTVRGTSGLLYCRNADNLASLSSASTARTNLGISTIGNTGAITDATGTLAVAHGGTGTTTSTGTTNAVLSNSPTLVTPVLGAASATSIAMGNGNITAAKAVYLNGKVAGGNKTGATVALFDWTAGPFQTITLTGSVTGTSTCTAPTSTITGLTALVVQGGAGSFTVASWCPGTKWVGGSAPTLSTVAGRVDRITCDYDATNYWCKAEINLQ